MSKVLIIVHHKFTEFFLSNVLKKVPNVEVIAVPYTVAAHYSLENAQEQLKQVLNDANTNENQVDVIIVEANYGTPASNEINAKLLQYLLENFEESIIIGYSSTTAALANVLQFNPRMMVMDNNNKFDEDVLKLCHLLKDSHISTAISSRVLTIQSLKDYLSSPSEGIRKRSATSPHFSGHLSDKSSPLIRRNTSPSLTPMFSLAQQQTELQAPNQEQAKIAHKGDFSKMDF